MNTVAANGVGAWKLVANALHTLTNMLLRARAMTTNNNGIPVRLTQNTKPYWHELIYQVFTDAAPREGMWANEHG